MAIEERTIRGRTVKWDTETGGPVVGPTPEQQKAFDETQADKEQLRARKAQEREEARVKRENSTSEQATSEQATSDK